MRKIGNFPNFPNFSREWDLSHCSRKWARKNRRVFLNFVMQRGAILTDHFSAMSLKLNWINNTWQIQRMNSKDRKINITTRIKINKIIFFFFSRFLSGRQKEAVIETSVITAHGVRSDASFQSSKTLRFLWTTRGNGINSIHTSVAAWCLAS